MRPSDWLAEQFEQHRGHLRGVAVRMLGSRSEADDAVQEAWLRLARSDSVQVGNLGGWLTTVVARVCLDALRARKGRGEEPLEPAHDPSDTAADPAGGPEYEALLADSLGSALLLILDTLAPAERLAFVLHDLFGMPFDEVGAVLGHSTVNARQLASRARRRVQGAAAQRAQAVAPVSLETARQRRMVDAFLAASRNGDFAALVALLDPQVELRADAAAVGASAAALAQGAPPLSAHLRGAHAVAETFKGRAQAARPARIDGAIGAAWAPGGAARAVFAFAWAQGRIARIEIVVDPQRLAAMRIELL